MPSHNFLCPHCDHSALIDDRNFESKDIYLGLNKVGEDKIISYEYIVCPNPKCKKSTLTISVHYGNQYLTGKKIFLKRILPPFASKHIPPCVPEQISNDYIEACEICELSPKASATLIRRCLQGMIRDFWQVKERTLAKEIEAIKDRIEGDTWEAIESIRKIGNIGAHMEKDIDLIIDVEPEETKLLIELVESLFEEWYVNRQKRKERNAQIIAVRDQKEAQRRSSVPALPQPLSST